MSLILEALKKSETRRNAGEAPNINTPFTPARHRRSPLPALLALIAAALIIGWWWASRSQPTAPAPTATSDTVASVAPAATPNTTAAAAAQNPTTKPGSREPAPTTHSSAAEHMPNTSTSAVPSLAQKLGALTMPSPDLGNTPAHSAASEPKAAATAALSHQPGPAAAEKTDSAKPAAAPIDATATVLPLAGDGANNAPLSAPPPPSQPTHIPAPGVNPQPESSSPAAAAATPSNGAATPTTDASALPMFFQLPYTLRKDLPAIKISMHVYAIEAAQRFVIINGARQIEGDALNTELNLREIRPNEIVLEFRGQKFIVPRSGT